MAYTVSFGVISTKPRIPGTERDFGELEEENERTRKNDDREEDPCKATDCNSFRKPFHRTQEDELKRMVINW